MEQRSPFWPSAVAAFLGAYVAVAFLGVTWYSLGQFDCGKHIGPAAIIPFFVAVGVLGTIAFFSARRFDGWPPIAFALAAPIFLVSSLMLVFTLGGRETDCHDYAIFFPLTLVRGI